MASATEHRVEEIRPRGAMERLQHAFHHLSLHYQIVFREASRANQSRRRFGGTSNHAHLLLGMRATTCLAALVRDVKAVSSRWMHEEIGVSELSWQEDMMVHSP